MHPDISKIAAVVGIGHTDWRGDYAAVRAGEVKYDSLGYAAVAFRNALADFGLKSDEVDGLIAARRRPTSASAKCSASTRAGAIKPTR